MTPSFRPQDWTGKLLKICRNLEAFAIGGFSKTKREQYDKDMYDEKRRNGELAAAREDGIAEGHAEAKIEMVIKFKALGVDIDTIVQATGLDRETIESL